MNLFHGKKFLFLAIFFSIECLAEPMIDKQEGCFLKILNHTELKINDILTFKSDQDEEIKVLVKSIKPLYALGEMQQQECTYDVSSFFYVPYEEQGENIVPVGETLNNLDPEKTHALFLGLSGGWHDYLFSSSKNNLSHIAGSFQGLSLGLEPLKQGLGFYGNISLMMFYSIEPSQELTFNFGQNAGVIYNINSFYFNILGMLRTSLWGRSEAYDGKLHQYSLGVEMNIGYRLFEALSMEIKGEGGYGAFYWYKPHQENYFYWGSSLGFRWTFL